MRYMIFILALALAGFRTHIQGQTVKTQYGNVSGTKVDGVYEFLGIPYAAPPVGHLRWKSPVEPEPWDYDYIAREFPPKCPQRRCEQGEDTCYIEGDENCLFLNVWTPDTGNAALPVLVFIHGGGNQQGSANQVSGGTEIYYGKHIAERGPAVAVTIQYRLGPLGFLVHPGLELEHPEGLSGNYAVLDQIFALQWIRHNIADFGGDPGKVMIFGESGGGLDVGNLLATPLAEGLFQRACIQSAVPITGSYPSARDSGIAYVNRYIQTGTDSEKLQYMRTLESDTLVYFNTNPLEGGIVQMNWQAVVDNSVFFDSPENTIQGGAFNKVPLIIGSNADEMSVAVPEVVPKASLNLYLLKAFGSENYNEALGYYPNSPDEVIRDSYIRLLTDGQFTATTRRTADCVSKNQAQPVFRYFFSHHHAPAALAGFGAYHGIELFYVFNTWEDSPLSLGPFFTVQDDSVQNHMLRYWVNFANTGNPNGPGLVEWEEYDPVSDNYLEIKATPAMATQLRKDECDLFDLAIHHTVAKCSKPKGETTVCSNAGTSIYLTDTIPYAENYIWKLLPEEAGVINGSETLAEITWNTGYNGETELFVAADKGCQAGEFSDILRISVGGLPGKPSTPAGITEICRGEATGQVYATPAVSNAALYQWSLSPGEAGTIEGSDTTASLYLAADFKGSFQITVTGQNQCGTGMASDALFVSVADCTSEIDFQGDGTIQLIPNPVSGIVRLNIPEDFGAYRVNVYNSLGSMVFHSFLSETLDFSALPNDVYLIEIRSATGTAHLRAVKTDQSR